MHNEAILSQIFCPWEEVSGLGRAPGTVTSSCPFQPSPQIEVWGHSNALLQPPPNGRYSLLNGDQVLPPMFSLHRTAPPR